MDRGHAIDPQAPRLVETHEQQPDLRVHRDVAEALEHAVAVVVREGELVGRSHPHKAGEAALEGAVWAAVGVGGGEEEEEAGALDEGPVGVGERGAREMLFFAIGDAAAAEGVLQAPAAFMVEE